MYWDEKAPLSFVFASKIALSVLNGNRARSKCKQFTFSLLWEFLPRTFFYPERTLKYFITRLSFLSPWRMFQNHLGWNCNCVLFKYSFFLKGWESPNPHWLGEIRIVNSTHAHAPKRHVSHYQVIKKVQGRSLLSLSSHTSGHPTSMSHGNIDVLLSLMSPHLW